MTPLSAHHTITHPPLPAPATRPPAFEFRKAADFEHCSGPRTVPATRPLLQSVPADLVLLQFGGTAGQPPVGALDRFEASAVLSDVAEVPLSSSPDGLALPPLPSVRSNGNGEGFDDVLESIMAGFGHPEAEDPEFYASGVAFHLPETGSSPEPEPAVVPQLLQRDVTVAVVPVARDATLTSGNADPVAPVTEVKFAVDAELAKHFSEDDYLVSKGAWAKLLKAARLSPALVHRAKQIRRKSLSCIYAERSRKKVSAQQKDNMKQASSLRDENTHLQEENRALLREIARIKSLLGHFGSASAAVDSSP